MSAFLKFLRKAFIINHFRKSYKLYYQHRGNPIKNVAILFSLNLLINLSRKSLHLDDEIEYKFEISLKENQFKEFRLDPPYDRLTILIYCSNQKYSAMVSMNEALANEMGLC